MHPPSVGSMIIRRWATASGAFALCFGTSPCHSFMTGYTAILKQCERNIIGGGGVVGPCPKWAMSTATAQDVVASIALTPEGSSGGPEAGIGRRWIKDTKAGDKVIGYVADTTNFAAFVDVGVVRHGSKGKVVPVTGFLHLSEVKPPYALEGTIRAKHCEVEVKKGIHLTAYVKDVFPNAGRLTLSLDPNINKEKVLKMRESKRKKGRSQRRERLAEKGGLVEAGEVVEGYIREVRDTMILVDVMLPRLSVLRADKIRDALGGSSFINLAEKAKPGDVVTVRIEGVQHSERGGLNDTKALVKFVGWGGLSDQEIKPYAEAVQAEESKIQEKDNTPRVALRAAADGEETWGEEEESTGPDIVAKETNSQHL